MGREVFLLPSLLSPNSCQAWLLTLRLPVSQEGAALGPRSLTRWEHQSRPGPFCFGCGQFLGFLLAGELRKLLSFLL